MTGESEQLAAVLDRSVDFMNRYLVLPNQECFDALALWAAATHLITDSWPAIFPPLIVTSPEKRSGKTRVLDVLEGQVAQVWRIGAAPTAAILYRVQGRVTCFIDEADRVFCQPQDNGPLIAIIDDGWRRDSIVYRCSENGDVTEFPAFAPRVLCGIDASRWPDTIVDRAILLTLTRKRRDQPVERWQHKTSKNRRTSYAEAIEIGEAMAELAALGETAEDIEVPGLIELDDRANDGWDALRQVAAVAGGDWPARARRAAIVLSADRSDEDTLKVTLLRDIAQVFAGRPQVATAELIERLAAIEESPWASIGRHGLDASYLARMLKPFGVKSQTIRTGETTCKGYKADDLAPVLEAYVHPRESRHTVTTGPDAQCDGTGDSVAVTKNAATTASDENVTALPLPRGDARACDGEPVTVAVTDAEEPERMLTGDELAEAILADPDLGAEELAA